MSQSKHFNRLAWAITALTLVITLLFMNGGALGLQVMARTLGYEAHLFDQTRVHQIDIVMDNWDELIANATSEEYYAATVIIDGEAYKNIGIRGKGNTSLSNVASMNSERYSFKLEFDHYDSSKSYYGLDKLCLNNLIQDSTMMKDYLTYTLMNEFGVAAPLCSFVYITVNGEDWGLYLAVEGVEDGFLSRNYGAASGMLYKPDSLSFGGGRGNGKDFSMEAFFSTDFENFDNFGNFGKPEMPQTQAFSDQGERSLEQLPEGSLPDDRTPFEALDLPEEAFANSLNGMPGGFGGMGSSDVKLQYIDDALESYENIWESAKTTLTTADKTRLIASLRKLSSYEELESVVDIDAVLRYFVVHNYVRNGDSYTGSMIHNYYLYEKDGRLSMIPWDYNLAFGTFAGNHAASEVNAPIDSPIDGGDNDDRPMWGWILSSEEYTTLYHRYFEEFLSTIDIQAIIDKADTLICSYVEKDPTKFYTYEEYESGVHALRQFCALRSESVTAQLQHGETTETMSYADASTLSLSDMGTMNDGNRGMPDNVGELPSGDFTSDEMPELPSGEAPSSDRSESLTPPSGELPSAPDAAPFGDIPGEAPSERADFGEAPPELDFSSEERVPTDEQNHRQDKAFSARPGEMPTDDRPEAAGSVSQWLWIALSALLLGVGIVIAKRYRA